MTNQFDLVGYSSVFIVKNIGSMFIFLNMQIALVMAALVLKYFNLAIWKNKKIDAFVGQVTGARTIEFFKNNYMVLCTVSFVQAKEMRFGSRFAFAENFCSSLACLGLLFSIAFPIWVFWKLVTNLRRFDPDLNQEKNVSELLRDFKGT